MMPNVNISSRNFQRLQRHAVPLVDDFDSVLERILDTYESQASVNVTNAEMPDDLTCKDFPPDAPPSLTYTSVRSIKLEGEPFTDKYWNPLLFEVIRLAAQRLEKDKFTSVLDVNYSTTPEQNFVEIPGAGIYVQGRDSNLCWRSIYKLARAAGLALEVEFYWQDKPNAAFPGKTGRFVVGTK